MPGPRTLSSAGSPWNEPRHDPRADGPDISGPRLYGRAGGLRTDWRRAGRYRADAHQLSVDHRPAVPRHRFRNATRDSLLSAGWRADDLVRRDPAHDPPRPGPRRTPARRAGAGGDTV